MWYTFDPLLPENWSRSRWIIPICSVANDDLFFAVCEPKAHAWLPSLSNNEAYEKVSPCLCEAWMTRVTWNDWACGCTGQILTCCGGQTTQGLNCGSWYVSKNSPPPSHSLPPPSHNRLFSRCWLLSAFRRKQLLSQRKRHSFF